MLHDITTATYGTIGYYLYIYRLISCLIDNKSRDITITKCGGRNNVAECIPSRVVTSGQS